MPQVDLEALVLVCGGGGSGDRKISCETLADGGHQDEPEAPDVAEVHPDFPPESFWLSKDAEFDWFDRNAFYERKESTKGNSNSNSYSYSHSNSSSQRLSSNLKSKASILGLPKTQKTNYVDSKRRNCKPPNIHLFPTRSESAGRSAVPESEPLSPKVSCIGRVRSMKGCRSRRQSEQPKTCSKRIGKERTGGRDRKKLGFYTRLLSLFSSRRSLREKKAVGREEQPVELQSPPRNSVTVKLPVTIEPEVEVPGLGGMKRFASGRRSESWNTVDFDVSHCDLKDLESPVDTVTDGPTGRC